MGTLPESSGTVTCQPGDNVRYICPHHINLMEEDSEVDLYFRVNHPEEKVVIRLLCNGKELKGKGPLR